MRPWEFCHTDCEALCCRTGKLNLKERELSIVVGERRAALEKEGRLIEVWDGTWSLTLSPACPVLGLDDRCTVYRNRPDACRRFPLFVFNQNMVTVDWCPLVRSGRLRRRLSAFVSRGGKVL